MYSWTINESLKKLRTEKKFLELNNKENIYTKIIWTQMKAVLRIKFVILNAYIKNPEISTK